MEFPSPAAMCAMDSAIVRRSSMIVSKCKDTCSFIPHPEPFLESLRNGERKTASAVDSSGEGVILFGVPCEYPICFKV